MIDCQHADARTWRDRLAGAGDRPAGAGPRPLGDLPGPRRERAGLIGGPGDRGGRTGYWVARAARAPAQPMLVPGPPDHGTQVIDARDLAGWLVSCAESGVTGIYDTVGPAMSLADWIRLSRQV